MEIHTLKAYFSTSKIDSPLILLHCLDENKRCGQTFSGFLPLQPAGGQT